VERLSPLIASRGWKVCVAGMKPYMCEAANTWHFSLAPVIAGFPENRPFALRCRDADQGVPDAAGYCLFYRAEIRLPALRLQADRRQDLRALGCKL
jgi:hypothetical protein